MNSILKSDLFEAFANASDKIYIYVSDMKTGITHWSRTAVYDFDLPDEYITDTNTLWLEHVHPEDRDLYLTDIMAVLVLLGFILTCCYKAV